MPRAKLITGTSEVPPETLGNPFAVELLRQGAKRLLPLRQSSGAVALLVVGDGQAVVHVGAAGRKFERVLVLGDCMLGVTCSGVIVGEGQVSGSTRRAFLKDRRQKIVGIAKLRHAEIFAVPRAVVIPGVASELLRAIDRLGKSHTDRIVAQCGEERVADVRRGLGKVESDERIVGLRPYSRARLSARLHDRVREWG